MELTPKIYGLLPSGRYPAQIVGIEEVEGKYSGQLRFTFNLGEVADVDGNVEERTLTGYTGNVLSNNSHLWRWVQATGYDPAEGVNTDDMILRRVVLEVAIEARKNGEGNRNKITLVSRPQSTTKANGAGPAKPKPVPDDDDGSEL